MKRMMWVCIVLAVINFVYMLKEVSNDKWAKATFHLVLGVWMWYIVTII